MGSLCQMLSITTCADRRQKGEAEWPSQGGRCFASGAESSKGRELPGKEPQSLWLSTDGIFIQVGKWCSKERERQVKLRQGTWISQPSSGTEKLKKSSSSWSEVMTDSGLTTQYAFLRK